MKALPQPPEPQTRKTPQRKPKNGSLNGPNEAGMPQARLELLGHAGRFWEVIVEPDDVRELLVVITAYPVEQP